MKTFIATFLLLAGAAVAFSAQPNREYGDYDKAGVDFSFGIDVGPRGYYYGGCPGYGYRPYGGGPGYGFTISTGRGYRRGYYGYGCPGYYGGYYGGGYYGRRGGYYGRRHRHGHRRYHHNPDSYGYDRRGRQSSSYQENKEDYRFFR